MVKEKRSGESGFTILEVIVAMGISMVVAAAIYSVYTSHLANRTVQDSVLEMQQNLRAAMYLMGCDVRKAGYQGPMVGTIRIAGITQATNTSLQFTYVANEDGIDNNGDGTIDEFNELSTITYALSGTDFMRTIDGGLQDTVAENIENIEFIYVLNDAANTNILNPSAAQLPLIRDVSVTLLVRSSRLDPKFTNTTLYTFPPPSSGESTTVLGPFNDHFRRELLTGTFFLRNMRN